MERTLRQSLVDVGERDRDDFLSRSEAAEDFAHSIFPERAHTELARALTKVHGLGAIVHQVADFVIDDKNFEDAHSSLVTSSAALFAADRFHPNNRGYATWLPALNQALAAAVH